jgi:hypothetical protein
MYARPRSPGKARPEFLSVESVPALPFRSGAPPIGLGHLPPLCATIKCPLPSTTPPSLSTILYFCRASSASPFSWPVRLPQSVGCDPHPFLDCLTSCATPLRRVVSCSARSRWGGLHKLQMWRMLRALWQVTKLQT